MTSRPTYFYEVLGPFSYLRTLLQRRVVFYCRQSTLMRLATKALRLRNLKYARVLWYGEFLKTTGIRRGAYEVALETIANQDLATWNFDPKGNLGIDLELVAEKVLLDHLFSKYEFYNFASQYARENPQARVVLVASRVLFTLPGAIDEDVKLRYRFELPIINYVAGVVSAVSYSAAKIWRSVRRPRAVPLRGRVVCEVDGPITLAMFRSVFGDRDDVHYVAQAHYLGDIGGRSEADKLGIALHRFDRNKADSVISATLAMLTWALRSAPHMQSFGSLAVAVYRCVVSGIEITPDAKDCAYLTFEHMSSVKAVRNELLRSSGSTSVFVPYNTYAIDHYFSPEYRYNYSVLCSPGRALEEVYSFQRAKTETMLPTGSYSPHQQLTYDAALESRLTKLNAFRNGRTLITILSPGIQHELLSIETRLMSLARRLADQPGVCVVIRQKPVTPAAGFESFYADQVGAHPNILLTHAEYQLFDFLHVTDLFVTSISSSALDLCCAGGQMYSVDFWSDSDLYLWQTAIEGVFLEENSAFDSIMSWVNDSPNGTRELHRERMSRLVDFVSYRHSTFAAYKENLLKCLQPYLPTPGAVERLY